MKSRMLFATLAVCAALPVSAVAAPVTVHYDAHGMPRCLELDSRRVYLRWNDDPYSREIRAYPLEQLRIQTGLLLHRAPQSCSVWRQLDERKIKGPWLLAGSSNDRLAGIPLGVRLRRSFEQISSGGNVYRSFDSGEEYLNRSGLKRFDIRVNRALTRAYGVSFASNVYRAWVERDQANASFRKKLLARLSSDAPPAVPTQPFSRVKFLLVDGWGSRDPSHRVTVEVMAIDLRRMGLDASSVYTEPYGDIRDNAERVAKAMAEALRSGKDVVLGAASRGVAEGLTAVAELSRKGYLAQGPGKLIGFLNFSGLVGGSFVADWIVANPGARGLTSFAGLFPDNALSSAADLNRREVGSLNAENFRRFPRDVAVLNLVGIPPGKGLSTIKKTRMLQDHLVRKYMKGYGANDALVEYPEVEIPRAAAPRAVTLILDGSHILFDGTLKGATFTPRVRYQFFATLLRTLIEDGHLRPSAATQ